MKTLHALSHKRTLTEAQKNLVYRCHNLAQPRLAPVRVRVTLGGKIVVEWWNTTVWWSDNKWETVTPPWDGWTKRQILSGAVRFREEMISEWVVGNLKTGISQL